MGELEAINCERAELLAAAPIVDRVVVYDQPFVASHRRPAIT